MNLHKIEWRKVEEEEVKVVMIPRNRHGEAN